MQNSTQHEPVSPQALARKHECQDPPLRGILLVGASVLLTMFVCQGIIWVVMHAFNTAWPAPPSPNLGIITAPSLAPLERFPPPHLQLVARDERLVLTAREEKELNTYGWLNRTSGVVRIPIARAMDLVSQRGLPFASSNAAAVGRKSSLGLLQDRPLQR